LIKLTPYIPDPEPIKELPYSPLHPCVGSDIPLNWTTNSSGLTFVQYLVKPEELMFKD